MIPKEIFWIGAKGGLVAEKHYRCMRDSVWLFLWLLLRQTGVNEMGEGVVNYGHPISRKEIEADTGFGDRRIERWTDVLRRTEYIRTQSGGKDGLIFFVMNAKSKTKAKSNTPKMVPVEARPAPTMVPPTINGASQALEDKGVTLVGGSPITKSLSYYNKDAATAVNILCRSKSLPKQKTQKQMRIDVEQQKTELRKRGLLN